MTVVLLSLAGALGAVARVVADGVVRARYGRRFPVGTVAINVTGSLVLGVLTGLVLAHDAPDGVRTIAGAGFCGGYTTFSTASFETARLVHDGRPIAAVVNAAGTLLLSLLAAGVGLALTGVV